MTIFGALRDATKRLEGKVSSPEVDAELLLRHVLNVSRAELYARSSSALDTETALDFFNLLERREAGEPLQYLIGTQAFRGLELAVGPGVLIPRPETELLVERAMQIVSCSESPLVVDVGTGSGAIAFAIAKECMDAEVWAVDVSDQALEWARANAGRLGLQSVTFLQSDLFDSLPATLRSGIDLVVSNPPYLSDEELESSPVDVRVHEPRLATSGGRGGAELSQRLVREAPAWIKTGGHLLLETSPAVAETLRVAMLANFRDVIVHRDLTGQVRFMEGRKP